MKMPKKSLHKQLGQLNLTYSLTELTLINLKKINALGVTLDIHA
jgi:hypothetical protein